MAPTSEEHETPGQCDQKTSSHLDGDAVVISGVSTVMPGCHNIMEFADKLYGKVNMTKCGKPRWNWKLPELAKYHGTIPQLDRFDAQFFMVYHSLSHIMCAMTRKLLENSYQAVFDAGICPTELSGRSIGVFVAAGFGESEKACIFADRYLGIVGCNKTMCANRISYYLNLKGPSLHVDGEAAGAAVALEKAYASIANGQCEAAIVGGAKLLLHVQSSIHHYRLMKLCQDGNVKSYDMDADGHALSEGISVIFLQKYKDAKRVYASIRHIKSGFTESNEIGVSQKYGFYRDPLMLSKFLKKFYEEAKVSPSDVEYVEGFGSAIPDADKAELEAIDEVFCKDRTSSLPIGSVTSNVGYTDAASCSTAVMKLVLAYHTGKIAGNINCATPREDVEGLKAERLRILTEDVSFNRSFTAINNFSVTGIDAHVLLQGHYKTKNHLQYHSNIPHLVVVSGRQESSVQKILDDIKGRALDPEEIALLHNIHRIRILKHLARGFGIYSMNEKQEAVILKEEVDYYDDAKRPLWFVYSGMGSQWTAMGTQLMKIPIFADAIIRCHKALEPKGIDLINVITCPDKSVFDNILNSFIGIAAIQIGLTDILKAIGLVPDNIIGHSVGELGCAYADDCVTAEEMILMAYSRGLVSRETPFVRGSMAAVGMGYNQISKLLPVEIEVACHNGPDSSTISGPAVIMKSFVEKLVAQGVFAKEVPCSNIAYHSRYIKEAGPGLLRYLKEVVKHPKVRSKRWLSTSVPQDKWNESLAKYSSAEYHTNNLLSPVLFEETIKLVPHNAVLVEIAPHSLLQAILKRSLPETCKNIPLTRRGHEDNAMFLLEAIGKLYMEGFDVDMSALYPKIEFPVSTETKPLSHLVEWAYAEKFAVCQFVSVKKSTNAVYRPIISIYDEEYEFLAGNIINGRRAFPFSGALVLVWETLAMTIGKRRDHLSVQFKDITFHVQPPLLDDKTLELSVTLLKGSGRFEVTYEQGLIVDGHVTAVTAFKDVSKNFLINDERLELNSDDIYKLLFEKGYQYKDDFRSIHKANLSFTHVNLVWKENWVTLLDGILQMSVLRRDHKGISQPLFIKRICIDVINHIHYIVNSKKMSCLMDAIYLEEQDIVRCGGLVVEHITYKDKPSLLRQTVSLMEHKFVPFNQDSNNNIQETLFVYLQIIAENLNKTILNVVWISDSHDHFSLEELKTLLYSPPIIKLNVIPIKKNEIAYLKTVNTNPDFVLLHDALSDRTVMEALYHTLPSDTFIINLGEETESMYPTSLYRQICVTGKGKEKVELVKWKPSNSMVTTSAISVKNNADLEHLKSKRTELSDKNKLLILAAYPPPNGLIDLVKEWRSETGTNNLFVVMINRNSDNLDDIDFPSFDLVFNVLDNRLWGGRYYVPMKEESSSCGTAALQINNFGHLESLTWVEVPDVPKSCNLVTVQYAGLNVYDARRALAEISIKNSNDRGFGMDFSGVTERGERVMGLIKGNAVSKKVIAQPELLWPVPQHWTLEDAATVPLPYCLAFYCLAIKSKLIPGMNVLIHGGAGALGQAAISVCLANRINVFTTVSNVHKKIFLRKLFPNLPAHHIGSSRDMSFKDMVIKGTKEEGCHIIICSVPGELKKATLTCCATSGITLDIALVHTQENFSYGMYNMTKARSYSVIDFVSLFEHSNKEEMKLLQLMISEGITRGYVLPLSRVTYPSEEASCALRLLAASRHIGRVLLNLGDNVPIVRSRINCSLDACNFIFCDKDYFGLQIADKLINNGAKKLFIHCSKISPYLEYKQLLWSKLGIQVHTSFEKISKTEHVVNLLKDCIRWAPIEGIFVIKTGLNNNESVVEAKNLIFDLNIASKELCPALRYFTVIQENRIGNEICQERAQQGLNSVSLQLRDLEKFDDIESVNFKAKDSNLKWSCAIDGIERAVVNNKPNVMVSAQPLTRRTLMEEVNDIAGVNVADIVPENITLKEVGIDEEKAQEIHNMLEEKFNIIVSKNTVTEMTISSLKTLHETDMHVQKEVKGLDAYISFVDPDELQAEFIVHMQTLVNKSQLRPVDFNNEISHLCIVPGIEGLHHRFRKLCERLKLQALVLQPGFDVMDKTVEEMAQRLADIMMNKLVLEKDFYLLGYEFGILVAMEMAHIFEKQGLIGTVYCVGGTPEDICATMEAEFSHIDTTELQNNLIEHAYTLITKTESRKLNAKIRDAADWDEKVESFMEMIREQCSFSSQYLRSFINTIYSRIIMARDFVWGKQPLKSKIVVLKAKLPAISIDSLTDYHQIVVHELSASLPYALKDLRCSAIVNKYLAPNILEDFKKRNHCEPALVNEKEEFVFNYIEDD